MLKAVIHNNQIGVPSLMWSNLRSQLRQNASGNKLQPWDFFQKKYIRLRETTLRGQVGIPPGAYQRLIS